MGEEGQGVHNERRSLIVWPLIRFTIPQNVAVFLFSVWPQEGQLKCDP